MFLRKLVVNLIKDLPGISQGSIKIEKNSFKHKEPFLKTLWTF